MRSEAVIRMVPGEKYTPYSLARKLGAKILLESSSLEKGKERYSVLLVREAFQLLQDARGIVFRQSGSDRLYRVDSKARDILDVCQYFASQHQAISQDFPFPAGGIGYVSFEFARFCDTIKMSDKPDPLGLPDACYMFGHIFVIFDHYTDMLILLGFNYKEAEINLAESMEELEFLLDATTPDPDLEAEETSETVILSSPEREEEYKIMVAEVQREVIAGNLLQAVPSRRLQIRTGLSAMDAYRQLRRNNPSPYLFFADFGDYQLFGASPETHVKVKHGKVIIRPIAGTRRRGKNREEDSALEAELLADPKERAEHLMLVDLARNDLGRICEPGSVKVSDYMFIERYSHVMHIVSQVEGQLASGSNGIDALRATFPAGTVSGAPKIRAIEVISKLEKFQRRFYAGALGYIEPDGNLDTCIMIRCGYKKDDLMVLQAGGGVVYDSVPERELEETKEKLGATLAAVGLGSKGAKA